MPRYTTSLVALTGSAAIERISASPLHVPLVAPVSRIGLIAFVPLHPTPLAGPRHTRQVPISNCVVSTGSTRKGAGEGIACPSPPTSLSLTTGVVPKSAGVHEEASAHK